MSVQSEINRIRKNVTDTLQTIADTGVTVGEGSDALPAAAQALANEKLSKTEADETYLPLSGGSIEKGKNIAISAADKTILLGLRDSRLNGIAAQTSENSFIGVPIGFFTESTTSGGGSGLILDTPTNRQPGNMAAVFKKIVLCGAVDMVSHRITYLAPPTADADAANKKYVDDAIKSAIQNTWEASY